MDCCQDQAGVRVHSVDVNVGRCSPDTPLLHSTVTQHGDPVAALSKKATTLPGLEMPKPKAVSVFDEIKLNEASDE